MRKPFGHQYLEAVTDRWNQFFPPRYRVESSLVALNTIESPTLDWGASRVQLDGDDVVGFIIIKKSPAMLYAGPDQDVYHLSALAFDDAGIGVDLLADVKAILRNRGVAELRFGQDSRHFFPGCPTDVVALSDFLTISGFVGTGTSVDLERDLTGHVATPRPDGEFRYLTAEDYPSLDRFLRREFPGRWHYDVTHKATHDGSRPCVFGLLLDGEVQGFALLQGEGCEIPIGGAVWYASLWESWGSLGPIGVAKHLRGQGFGGALLDHALAQLAADGAKQTIIDWTNLVDFYGKFGFEVTRTYRTFSLRLDEA